MPQHAPQIRVVGMAEAGFDPGPHMGGDSAGIAGLVERLVVEAGDEGLGRGGRHLGRHRHHRRGIDAAAQMHPHRHVRAQANAYRILQQVEELLVQFGGQRSLRPLDRFGQRPVFAAAPAALGVPARPTGGGQLFHIGEGGLGRLDIAQ